MADLPVPKNTRAGRYRKVDITEDGKGMVVEFPIDQKLPLSKTGKSHLVFASLYAQPTGLFIAGREIKLQVLAYIERIPGRDE